jgi:hypothetical protein
VPQLCPQGGQGSTWCREAPLVSTAVTRTATPSVPVDVCAPLFSIPVELGRLEERSFDGRYTEADAQTSSESCLQDAAFAAASRSLTCGSAWAHRSRSARASVSQTLSSASRKGQILILEPTRARWFVDGLKAGNRGVGVLERWLARGWLAQMASPNTVVMQYMVLFSHRTVRLPAHARAQR